MSQRSRLSFPLPVWTRLITGIVSAIMLLSLGACTATRPAHTSTSLVQTPQPAGFDPRALAVVLVAGDSEQPVFDNAINYMHDALTSAGVPADSIHQLSVRYAASNEPATLDRITARIAAMRAPANGGCLVFLTSHGVYGQGFYVELSDAVLTPAALDGALRQGCGAAPTVVIVSSCFSGQFAAPPMVQENRIVLTASAADRSSFGCGADFTYTYFDDCMMGSLAGAGGWKEIFWRAAGCVAQREAQSGTPASNPQADFGDLVADLPSPWERDASSSLPLAFQASGKPYNPRRVPLSASDREAMQDELNYYARATPPKALAIAPIGLATAAAQDGTDGRSADDVARIALQRCEWLTGGGCILYARDNAVTAMLPSGLPPFHPQILVRRGPLAVDSVPFIRDDQRTQVANYMALSGPKALALSPSHDEISIGTGQTPALASQEALARCQFVMENCILYAEGDHVVLGW